MGSKVFIFTGLLLALVLLISSEVAARDLAETADSKNDEVAAKTNGVGDAKYGDYNGGGGYGGGDGYNHGGGYGGGYGRGGGYGGGGYGGGYGGGHGYYCRYGCCGGGYYYGRGCRCCNYAGEAETLGKPHN